MRVLGLWAISPAFFPNDKKKKRVYFLKKLGVYAEPLGPASGELEGMWGGQAWLRAAA